jgi:hypothetical protein
MSAVCVVKTVYVTAEALRSAPSQASLSYRVFQNLYNDKMTDTGRLVYTGNAGHGLADIHEIGMMPSSTPQLSSYRARDGPATSFEVDPVMNFPMMNM